MEVSDFTVGDKVKYLDLYDDTFYVGEVYESPREGFPSLVGVQFAEGVADHLNAGGYRPSSLHKVEEKIEQPEEDVTDALIWMLNNAPPWVCHRLAETMKKYKEQT